ncbi:MAG: hypothetical protein PHF29_08250, partial [Candidatus Riflebacteria bacterium]|nr:hypothetical protein [Candidatus Riflebacteria bacterium]
MLMFKCDKRAMAGIMTIILILGLLMTVSISYIKVMDVEGLVQEMSDYSDRAEDAAFSGVSYAMAVAQSSKDIFRGIKKIKSWPYMVEKAIVNDSYKFSAYNGIPITDLVNIIESQWIYLNEKMKVVDDEEVTTPPYRFRVITYPHYTFSTTTYDDTKYMVKAQGNYLVYQAGTTDVVATHSAQLLAELTIDKSKRQIFLKKYRRMPF